VTLGLLVLLGRPPPAPAQQPSGAALEPAVKAEFIERFTHFVEWPKSAFASPQAPFVVCALGESPLVPALDRLVSRGRLQERPARFDRLRDAVEVDRCHILYIALSEERSLPRILARTADRPILTVGDSPGFGARGVLINFYVEQAYVRFEINPGAVKHSGLKVSAKLMTLARLVGTTGG
jgi:hypothetical protein